MKNNAFLRELFGNIDLNLTVCKYDQVYDGWSRTDLVRDYSKLYFIQSGKGDMVINGVNYQPRAGDFLLIPEGICHSFSTVASNRYIKYYCHFTAEVNGMNIFNLLEFDYLIRPKSDQVKGHFEGLLKAFNGNDAATSAMYINSCLLSLLARYFDGAEVKEAEHNAKTLESMKTVSDYIYQNLNQPLSNQLMADIVHLHPNYFSQLFKSIFGLSPVKYVNQRRMEKAKYYLRMTEQPISKIAESVGFMNVYHFSTAFKKYSEVSPTTYRKTSDHL